MGTLGVLPPDIEPRATQHVDQMIEMIAALIEKGFAYEAEGHVLFDVEANPDYGKLSKRDVREMIAGARVEVAPYKKAPQDFVLWKPSTPELPGWESPWGRGRPGWHIECSAMSAAHLGRTIDILRKDTSIPIKEAIPAACDELWREVLKERVEAALRELATQYSVMNNTN